MRRELPAVAPRVAEHRKPVSLMQTLLDDSIVIYLAAVTAQKTWVLLNADLFQLIRRTH